MWIVIHELCSPGHSKNCWLLLIMHFPFFLGKRTFYLAYDHQEERLHFIAFLQRCGHVANHLLVNRKQKYVETVSWNFSQKNNEHAPFALPSLLSPSCSLECGCSGWRAILDGRAGSWKEPGSPSTSWNRTAKLALWIVDTRFLILTGTLRKCFWLGAITCTKYLFWINFSC